MTVQASPDQRSAGCEEQFGADSRRGGRVSRYRYLIAVVSGLETTVTIDQVVDAMLEWEAAYGAAADEKSRHDVQEELYLVDLPTLDRAGFVEFDPNTGTLTGGTRR
ncbi:DUF7344 domain-containing protein [Halorarius litoreus]|uniref:DUF7344 domain-containing protein n=1 Tax=Halorarius litoreus TaxID=2962676 RepID=UPI0020CCE939|nr:hypothetical protein [Halorarius litoreus]